MQLMKKLMQFVALLLTLSVSTLPILAQLACAQRACGNRPSMACCPSSNSTSLPAVLMGMTCSQTNPTATAPILCTADHCCIISTAIAPAITSSTLTPPTANIAFILPGRMQLRSAFGVTKPPIIPNPALPTRRYILFRDIRI